MFNNDFLAHFCCAIAIFIWNLSIQNKKMEKILYFQFLSNMLYGLSYFLLGVPIAAIMDSLGSLRCFLFYYKKKKEQDIPLYWLFIFCLLVIALGIINYNGIISLIPIIITIFYTISSWANETNWLRIIFILAAILWIYYNLTIGAYVAVVGNFFEIISGAISIYRFKKTEHNKT